MLNLVGQTIGQYQLVELISQGENVVYKGFQPSANRYVAVKILDSARAADPAFVQQFQQDMRVRAGLQHPNLLPVDDYGQYNGWLFLITPFIEGATVKERLSQFYHLSPAQALVETIAGALDYLHGQGVIHGNLKPGNVLLDEQRQPLLTDFGYTQGIDVGAREPAYLSPELSTSGILDRRTDTYALGVLLHELLIGEPPQPGLVPNPRLERPDLPVEVEKVILKALAHDPAQRFQTAGELSHAFQLAIPGQAIYATPSTAPESEPESQQASNRLLWIVGGALALLAILACAIFFFAFGGFRSSGSGANAVVPTPEPAVPAVTALVNADIYSGPGEVYDIIGRLQKGQSAEAIGRSPDQRWWAIKVAAVSGGQGWVSGDLVESTNTANVPIIQPPPTPTPVQGEPQPPKAAINGTTQAQVGQQVNFSARNSSVAEGSHLVSFDWDFGDGATASGVDVTHVYDSPGSYAVRLTVIDDKDLDNTDTLQVEISEAPVTPEPEESPVAVISGPSEAEVGETVTFDAEGSQSANEIVSYAWDLGDGTTANAVRIDHVYGSSGLYNVILTVTDDKGLSGTSNVQINVVAQPGPEPTEEPPTGEDLENIEWVLNGTLPDTEITAFFQAGTVSGSAGCNTYTSTYQVDGTDILIAQPSTSGLTCEEAIMEQENRYFTALTSAQSYEVLLLGRLRITGGETMTFSTR